MLGQGKEAAKMYLRENTKVMREISEAIWKIVKSGHAQPKVAPSEASEE